MSGRRSKQIRKKSITLGALVAYGALGAPIAQAQVQQQKSARAPHSTVAELPMRRFDIAPGPLDVALNTYEKVTGIDVDSNIPSEALKNLNTAGVSGVLTNQDALRQLLAESGIEFRFNGRRSVTLQMQGLAEAIDVTSSTPSVASPKYTQPVLDTPQTITVIPEEVFESQGATTLRDILRNTPGITFQAGEGGGGLPGDNFSMRGFSASNDVLVDGVREVGAYSRDAFNLEQVEVIKGPTSATAGRGATGGSINLVTKSPKPDHFMQVAAGTGSEGYTRGSVDLNQPIELIPSAAIRFNAMYQSAGVARRDVVENNGWGIAPSIAFGIGKPTRIVATYQHLEQDNVPDYGLPWAALEGTPRADQSNFYGLEDYDYEDVKNDLANVIVEHDLNDRWTLRNLSRWADNHRDSAITAPRPPNRQLQQRQLDTTQLANQTSLSGSFGMHDFVAGLDISRETKATKNQAQTTNQPQTNIFDPDPSQRPFGPMPKNVGNPDDATLDTIGLYVLDTVDVGSKWKLSAGLRYDDIDIDYELLTVSTGVVTKLAKQDSMVSWSAGATFKPVPAATIYASTGTSFNPSVDGSLGTVLSENPTSGNNINLDPEKTRNLELGGKYEFAGGRAVATGALFRTEKTNARTRALTTDPFVMSGKQRVDGVELGLSGRIMDGWTVFGGYSNLQTEFVESENPAEEGAALTLTPENSFNVWTTGELPMGLTIGGGAQYMDAVFRNATNTTTVPSYWLFSAMASYDLTPALTLRLNVNNLTDEIYVDRVGGGHYIPGAGRSFVISADFDF